MGWLKLSRIAWGMATIDMKSRRVERDYALGKISEPVAIAAILDLREELAELKETYRK